MKKTIRDFDLRDKRVIIRVDFNVPAKNGIVTDDTRIKEALPTIQYAVDHEARVIILSHMGRVKAEGDKLQNDLRMVCARLSKMLNKYVIFSDETRGEELEYKVNNLLRGNILLVQNTRYEDANGNLESSNDPELGKYWASLGEIFINDAFATSHRECASISGISKYLPSGIGFLVEKELKYLGDALNNPERPLTVILGGAKVSDKIGVIEYLKDKADYIIVGGGMSYSFLKAKGFNVGRSIVDNENLDFCKKVMNKRLFYTIDSVVTDSIEAPTVIKTLNYNEFDNNDIGVDIGPKTIELFTKVINNSKSIIWNGPMGIFENPKFSNGTKQILEACKNKKTIICGGDTASAVNNLGYNDSVTYISTGGGASLEFMKGKVLPGIGCINEKEN